MAGLDDIRKYNADEDLINRILSHKLDLIKSTIKDLSGLIEERLQIRDKTLSDLENEILRARNMILERNRPLTYVQDKTDPLIRNLEGEIFRLEKSKIDEKVKTWNDVLLLKRAIVDLQASLRSAETKCRLFDENENQN